MSDPRTTAPSILTRGAVDLGALRAPAPPAAAPGAGAFSPGAFSPDGAPSPGSDSMIIEVTEATFQADVVERSMQTPVVIDFWADWCQPCKQLTPVLEKLAREGGGSWILAKIDIDANPRIAAAFAVQSIPTVYAVAGGRPVDTFSGVVPEAQLRPWINAILQAGGVDAALEVPEDPRYVEADDAMMNGDLDGAEAAYKGILAEAPVDGVAEAGLAQVALLRRLDGVDPAEVLAAADAAPDDVTAQGLAADVEVLSGTADRGYARLVELVRRTSGADRDAARNHLVSLFTVAGPDDPAVAVARRALASALF